MPADPRAPGEALTPLPASSLPAPDPPPDSWRVWREDDNGNRFLVRDAMSEAAAHELVRHFEDLGHKQTYWAASVATPPRTL